MAESGLEFQGGRKIPELVKVPGLMTAVVAGSGATPVAEHLQALVHRFGANYSNMIKLGHGGVVPGTLVAEARARLNGQTIRRTANGEGRSTGVADVITKGRVDIGVAVEEPIINNRIKVNVVVAGEMNAYVVGNENARPVEVKNMGMVRVGQPGYNDALVNPHTVVVLGPGERLVLAQAGVGKRLEGMSREDLLVAVGGGGVEGRMIGVVNNPIGKDLHSTGDLTIAETIFAEKKPLGRYEQVVDQLVKLGISGENDTNRAKAILKQAGINIKSELQIKQIYAMACLRVEAEKYNPINPKGLRNAEKWLRQAYTDEAGATPTYLRDEVHKMGMLRDLDGIKSRVRMMALEVEDATMGAMANEMVEKLERNQAAQIIATRLAGVQLGEAPPREGVVLQQLNILLQSEIHKTRAADQIARGMLAENGVLNSDLKRDVDAKVLELAEMMAKKGRPIVANEIEEMMRQAAENPMGFLQEKVDTSFALTGQEYVSS